ncbi:Ig-like domain-containing protein [Haliangium ochraceum]|nr:Ig-like domain-containing protein [Haliangium ochraceum]
MPTDGGMGTDGGEPDIDSGTPPQIDAGVVSGVLINEVVLTPQRDWSKSGGVGEPFDGDPGTGTVSALDQYIEIINASDQTVSLSGWSIEVQDSSDGSVDATPLRNDEEANIVVRTSPGSSLASLKPGAFAILGNPTGTIGTDAYIVLRDNRGQLVDDVEIGDRADDDPSNGAPAPNQNGFAIGAFEEAIARPEGAGDTNNDGADFDKMFATPLRANVPPAPDEFDSTAPSAGAPDEGTDDWPINDFVRIKFSEQLKAADITASDLELRVNGLARAIDAITFSEFDSVILAGTTGVLPFGATVELVAKTTITDYAGNPLAAQQTITFNTEAAPPDSPAVMMTEICVEAQQDWSHSSGNGGIPFSKTPGTGSISASDEWIELRVITPTPLDLTDYTIEIFNGPSTDGPPLHITEFDDGKVDDGELRFFPATSVLTRVTTGTFVVLGNPTGSMDDDVYVILRDADGTILDEVEIGGINGSNDRGGDGANNGAPEPNLNGESTAIDRDETISRRVNGGGVHVDDGDDVDNWVHAAATLGAANTATDEPPPLPPAPGSARR